MKTQQPLLCIGLACSLALAGCGKRSESGAEPDMPGPDSAPSPAEKGNLEEVAKPNFTEAAKNPQYQQAIKDAAALLGARPQPLEGEDGPIVGGVSFEVPHQKIEVMLFTAHTNFLAKGFYLFRFDQSFDIGGKPDRVALLPTSDKYAVMAAMEVNGANFDLYTAGIIKWMKKLEQEQPYVLTGIGFDYMEGQFTSPVKDSRGLAKRMYKFCPDIVDQGVGSVEALSKELLKGKLYFWWD